MHSLLIFWVCLCHDPICIISWVNWMLKQHRQHKKINISEPSTPTPVSGLLSWILHKLVTYVVRVSLNCARVSFWEFNLHWSSAVLSSLHIWCFRRGSLCGAGGAVLFMELWGSWNRGNVGSAYCQCDRTKFSISYDKSDMCVYRGLVLPLLSPLIE